MTADPFDDDVLPDDDELDTEWPLPDPLPKGIVAYRNNYLKVTAKSEYITTFHRKSYPLAVQCLDEAKAADISTYPTLRAKYKELQRLAEPPADAEAQKWPLPDVLPRGITLMKNEIYLQVTCRLGYVTSFHRKFWDLAQQCLAEAKEVTDPDDLPALRTKYAELKLHSEIGKTIPLTKFDNGKETDKSKKLAREYKDEPENRGRKAEVPLLSTATFDLKAYRRAVPLDEPQPAQETDPAEAALVKAYRLERVARRARKEADSAWEEADRLLDEDGINLSDHMWMSMPRKTEGDQS